METGQDHTCRDCGTTYRGFYCPNCGLRYDEGRTDAKTQFQELLVGLLNFERYFFKTTINFIVRPGESGQRYLEGKRRGYHKPVAFVLLWVTIYNLVHVLVTEAYHYEYVLISPDLTPENAMAKTWFYAHFVVVILPSLIIISFPCWLIVGIPARVNYFEVLTMTFYAEGCMSMYRSVQDIVGGVLLGININHEAAFLTIFTISGIYNLWFTYDFSKHRKVNYLWPRLIGSFLSVLVINKFNFDYLTLIGMKLFG